MTETNPNVVEKFSIAGIITSCEFQKARYITEKLYASFPKIYDKPEIRSMLDVEWDEYLAKMRRREKAMWRLQKNVAIFVNGNFLGDDEVLVKYVAKKFLLKIHIDWHEVGKCHLVEYLRNIMGKFRQLAYMTISINHQVIGTMLFEVYNDLVPLTSENFLNKCKVKRGGYIGTPIHRIMKNSWIQCGGWKLPSEKMPCENYVVPHDRRGVLSMCNDGRHKHNSTQFYITLAPAPWMDYKYVAFGQLLHGNDILKKIENVPTYFESPKFDIDIVQCGEFTFHNNLENVLLEEFGSIQNRNMDFLLKDARLPSKDSYFCLSRFKTGAYCFATDLKSYYWPFMTPLDYLTAHYDAEDGAFTYKKCLNTTNINENALLDCMNVTRDPSSSDMTI